MINGSGFGEDVSKITVEIDKGFAFDGLSHKVLSVTNNQIILQVLPDTRNLGLRA